MKGGVSSSCSSSCSCSSSSVHDKEQDREQGPVLLFDVMDTIVLDPFYTMMPDHFGLTFEQVCCLLFEQHRVVEYCDV